MSPLEKHDPRPKEWNDSLKGEFLWSSVNTREGIPDVMTPSTWALWRIYYVDANPVKLPDRYPFAGNIGGRPYLNLSLVVSMYRAVGKDIRKEMHGDIIGSIPSDLEIPIILFSPLAVVWLVLPGMIQARRYARRAEKDLARFLAETPQWCREIRAQIQHTPHQAQFVQRRLEAIAEAARQREAVRSELTRLTRLIRQFLLRVGEVAGSGEDIFFLSLAEMVNLLAGG